MSVGREKKEIRTVGLFGWDRGIKRSCSVEGFHLLLCTRIWKGRREGSRYLLFVVSLLGRGGARW